MVRIVPHFGHSPRKVRCAANTGPPDEGMRISSQIIGLLPIKEVSHLEQALSFLAIYAASKPLKRGTDDLTIELEVRLDTFESNSGMKARWSQAMQPS